MGGGGRRTLSWSTRSCGKTPSQLGAHAGRARDGPPGIPGTPYAGVEGSASVWEHDPRAALGHRGLASRIGQGRARTLASAPASYLLRISASSTLTSCR